MFLPAVQLVEIMNETGIILDPVYTLKGVRGMLAEMSNNPARFLGRRVLYLHTGTYRYIHACQMLSTCYY